MVLGMDSSKEFFRYSPLQSPTQIRIVEIPVRQTALADNEIIEINLFHAEIDAARKKYAALSYVWGDQEHKHPIQVNGKMFLVTQNLVTFLRRALHYPGVTVNKINFWIDAICINQEDGDEKKSQIPLMTQIYRESNYVHADLGDATPTEQRLLDELPELSRKLRSEVEQSEKRNNGVCIHDELQVPHMDPYEPDFWNSAEALFSRPWWKRVWVMQEAAAIVDVLVYCGNKPVKFDQLDTLHMGLLLAKSRNPHFWDSSKSGNNDAISRLRRISSLWKTGTRLIDFLEEFRELGCTEEQDRVFAPMCLANDLKPGGISLDFESVKELYTKVISFYLDSLEYPLDVLGFCSPTHESLSNEFPSWIPEWNTRRAAFQFQKVFHPETGPNERVYKALPGNIVELLQLESTKPFIDGLTLNMRGYFVDEIESSQRSLAKWVPIEPEAKYVNGLGTNMDAFLHTLVVDLDEINVINWKAKRRGGQAAWDFQQKRFIPGPNNNETHRILRYCQGRAFATTAKRYMALVPFQTQPKDKIAALIGGSLLYVIRPVRDNFILVGECYVHGLMDGEVLELIKDVQSPERIIFV